jgi:hypothetical protein
MTFPWQQLIFLFDDHVQKESSKLLNFLREETCFN